MILYPNPKVNIGLNIINKREDGFHNLETLFYPVKSICDVLEIVKANDFGMFEYGIEYDGSAEDNICVKAYNLLKRDYDIPNVEIHLYKKIPVGAGLGGGSADGAFTLIGLNRLFNLNLSQEILASYASQLGSDCPFFIYNRPMFGRGRGEILEPLREDFLSNYRIELVCPDIFISTAEAYRGVVTRDEQCNNSAKLEELLSCPIEEWRGTVVNDFEKHLFIKYPKLAEIKQDLYERGAIYASMSGSGSAIFGIFAK